MAIKLTKVSREQSIKGGALLISPLLAVGLSLLVSAVTLRGLGYPVAETLSVFFITPLSSLYDVSEVITKASLLALIALGLTVGFKANIWNIGAEGQFILGAIFGSVVALHFYEQEGWFILPLMMLAGVLGGLLWGMIPALLKNYFNANEILSSLMLVYIAELLLSYLVHGPLKDPDGFNFPQTVYFSDSAIYPYLLEGTRLSLTPVLLLLLFPALYYFLTHSYLGYQLKVAGFSVKAAKYAGFSQKRNVWWSFAACGALAGLAGISEVSSNIGQLIPVISPGYGFTAIIVAFLGRLNPVGIIVASLLMALIYIGAENSQLLLKLPLSISNVFQGLILFCLLGSDYLMRYRVVVQRSPSPKKGS